jgi:hypothetical protein
MTIERIVVENKFQNRWGDYQPVKLVFENIDELIGDVPEDDPAHLYLPRRDDGIVFVPTLWQRNWIRHCCALPCP